MDDKQQNTTPEQAAPQRVGEEDTINLLDYLEVILKRKRFIFRVTAAAFFLSIIISLLMTKIYSATARILPPQQDQGMMSLMMGQMGGMASLAGDLLGQGTPSDLCVAILGTEAIKDPIIDRFKLMDVYDSKYRIDAYEKVDNHVTIEAGKKDGVVSITVEDEDPKRAAAIANAYVDELSKLTVRLNIFGATQNRTYLEERLAKARGDLMHAEEALKVFQAKNKIIAVQEQAKATIEGIAQLKAQIALQEANLATLRQQYTDSAQEVKNVKSSLAKLRETVGSLEGTDVTGALPSVGSMPLLGQEYLRLMRDFKTQETIVELLTKQYEMSKLTEVKNVSGVQVIQTARVPDKKQKPKRSLIVLAATFAVGFVSLLYTFICEAAARMPEEDRERWNRIRGMLPDASGFIRRLRRLRLLMKKCRSR